MKSVRVMLYVEDVDQCVQFWLDYVDAKIAATSTLPDGSQNVVLTVAPEVELSFFSKEFIKTFSPEVVENVPSLMFFTDRFRDLHAKIPNAGDISDQQGTLTFNFADPEGHYFVVAQA